MAYRALVAIAVSAFATTAGAAEFTCKASVETELAREVEAFVNIADDGTRTANVSWNPLADPEQSFGYADVTLVRAVEDIEARRLGPIVHILAFSMVTQDEVVGQRAVMIVSTNRVEPVAKEWGLFARWLASDDTADRPFAFLGSVPFGRDDRQSRQLVDSVANSRSLIVSAHDLKTFRPYTKGYFWLNHTEAVEPYLQAALNSALEMAKAPAANCRPPYVTRADSAP